MILLIDTAQENATVALADKGRVLFKEENGITKETASWLHPAIARLLGQADLNIRELKAVAVVAGPGSYTGLRVGMAAAKGLCYALKIPLITRNTLELMAASMLTLASENQALVCPMIDARRDEVYTAIYDSEGKEVLSPCALILDKNAFELELSRSRIIFFGSGSKKWEKMNSSPTALFETQMDYIQSFAKYAQDDFDNANWADPVYSEPVYLKEFFSY
jgi:tRNA threonylcarbamoyladenosine biosynthesis protein TsaB